MNQRIYRKFIVAICLLCSTVALAHDFEVDGIYYKKSYEKANEVWVTHSGTNPKDINEYVGNVVIPSTVTYNGKTYNVVAIASGAFTGCADLKSVVIPNSINSIGAGAFGGCSLESINIPASVNTIGMNAFAGCGNVKTITVENGNTVYDSRNNCNAIIETATNTLVKGCSSTIIPESVTSIGSSAFSRDTDLTSITLPNNTASINSNAFYGCTNLSSLTIGTGLSSIGSNAFDGCKNLSSIVVDGNNKTFDSRNNCNAIIKTSTNTLILGSANTIIPNSVTTIGTYSFIDRESLESIIIPESVVGIEYGAFVRCTGLNSVMIPQTVKNIGELAFYGCNKLNNILLSVSSTIIGDDAFDNTAWYNNLPDGVIYIDELLYGYKGTMPDNSVIEIKEGTTIIRTEAFSGCNKVKSITIPQSVTFIDKAAFSSCTGELIVNCNIPSCAQNSRQSFYSSYFTNVIIGKGVKSIGDRAFYDCSKLTSIEIPQSVTYIGDQAFNFCSKLNNVVIPQNVTSIGNAAFANCSNLTNLTSFVEGKNLFTINNAFPSKDKITLTVPYGSKSTYENTTGWSGFKAIVEMAPEYTLNVSAAGYATMYLDYQVEIPEGVEVYVASRVEGEKLKMTEVTGVLPANTGVVVKADQGSYTFTESSEPVSVIENNLLKGTVEDTYITPRMSEICYVLSQVDNEVGMYKVLLTDGKFKNNANKAYLTINLGNLGIYEDEVDTTVDQLTHKFKFDFGSETGVENITTTTTSDIYYNLNGVRINKPTQKGVYIKNGKKIIF